MKRKSEAKPARVKTPEQQNRARMLLSGGFLAVLAGVLRFINLGGENLWYDESFTAWLAKLPFDRMMQAIRGDVHPPLWYIVEWANVRVFGTSEWAIRLPSAVFGIVGVLLVWQLALALGLDKRTAFVAGALAAILPSAIYYSQEGRMYSMLAVFVLGALIAAVKERWILYALLCACAAFSQNVGVFYTTAISIVVILTHLKVWRTAVAPILSVAGFGLAYLPELAVLLKQAGAVKESFWVGPTTAGGVLMPFATMTMGWRLPDQIQAHAYAVAFGATMIGLVAARKWIFTQKGLLLIAAIFLTPALVALVSWFWRPIYIPRLFFPAMLALMILWAYPLMHLAPTNRKIARAALVPMMIAGVVFHYLPGVNTRMDIDRYSSVIKQGWEPGDVIYHMAIDSYVLMGYYSPDVPIYILPHASDLNQSLTEETKQAMAFNPFPFDQLRQQGYRRAWVIAKINPLVSTEQLAALEKIEAMSPVAVDRYDLAYNHMIVYLVTL